MPRKKITKAKTYPEFMAWLEGVESMQPEEWVPNAEQWKLIREMLDKLKIEPKVITKEVQVQVPNAATILPAAPAPAQVMMPAAPAIMPTETTSAFEAAPPSRPMPSGMTGGRNGVPNATSSKKGEVLDTSDGNYTSEFV